MAGKKAKKAPREWRNRIVGYGEESPEQILANPRNFRVHPKAQQNAIEGVLDEVGYVQAVVINRATNFLVDGHLRVAAAISKGQPTIPVVYVDLTQEEEGVILASLDPITEMAGRDQQILDDLLNSIETENENLLQFFDTLHAPGEAENDKEADGASSNDQDESADSYLIQYNIVFTNEREQEVWFNFLKVLKKRYDPDAEHASRIIRFIEESGILSRA